jgi:hypothetical protein
MKNAIKFSLFAVILLVKLNAVLAQPCSVAIVAMPNDTFDCVTHEITLTAVATGASPFTYAWSNSLVIEETLTITTAGTYTVTITAMNSCTSTKSIIIKDVPPEPTIAAPGLLTCTVHSIELSSSTPGNFPYTYAWSTIDGNIVSGADTPNPTVDDPGTYTLTVTNPTTSCTGTASVVVQENTTAPVITIGDPDELNCIVTTVTLHASATGFGPFGYDWTTTDGNIVNGVNDADAEVDKAGTYKVEITDSVNGCVSEKSVSVILNDIKPTVQISQHGVISCAVPTITLTSTASGQGNISYEWATAGGNIVSGGNTATAMVNKAGFYTVKVTDDANGCTESAITIVDDNLLPPTVSIATPGLILCKTPEIMLNAVGMGVGTISYLWATLDGNIVSGAGTQTPTVDKDGTYIVVVTDSNNGCTDTESVLVENNLMKPIATANPNSVSLDCNNPSATIQAGIGSNYSYQWLSPPDYFEIGNSDKLTVNLSSQQGVYRLIVTDDENGCTNSTTVSVFVPNSVPQANVGPDKTICIEQTTVIGEGTPQNNVTYVWTPLSGLTNPNDLVTNANPTITTTYTLTATKGTCIVKDSVKVTVNLPPVFTIMITESSGVSNNDNKVCAGDPITLSVQAGYESYAWSSPVITGTGGPIIPANNIVYTVTITKGGCTVIQSTPAITVVGKPDLALSAMDNSGVSFTDFIICLGDISTINTAVTGGLAPYSYAWSPNNQTTSSISTSPNQSAIYTVTVTDFNKCTVNGTQFLTVNKPPDPIYTVTDVVCQGDDVVFNGQGPTNTSWKWQKGTSGQDYSSMDVNIPNALTTHSGTYYVTVTDNITKCFAVESFLLTVAPIPTPTIDGATVVCQNQLNVVYNNGSPSFATHTTQWTWTPQDAATTQVPNEDQLYLNFKLISGIFILKLEEKVGQCSTSTSKTITISNNVAPDTVKILSYIDVGNMLVAVDSHSVCYYWGRTGILDNKEEEMVNGNFQSYVFDYDTNQYDEGKYRYWLDVERFDKTTSTCGSCRNRSYAQPRDKQSTEPIILEASKLIVMPNPNDGNFQIKLETTEPGDWQFILCDVLGRVLNDEIVHLPSGTYNKAITRDQWDWNTGLYYLKVSSKALTGGVAFVKPIVVQR